MTKLQDILTRVYESPKRKEGVWGADATYVGIRQGIKRSYLEEVYIKLPVQYFIESTKKLQEDGSLQPLYCYLDKDKSAAICGFFTKHSGGEEGEFELFTTLCQANLVIKEVEGYGEILQTSESFTLQQNRGMGLATSLYLSLVYSGYKIMSDVLQYDGAAKLWHNLSNRYEDTVVVDVYHNKRLEVIDKKYKIKSWEFNSPTLDQYWSKDYKGMNYQFIAYLKKELK